jgi:hypothetical protein
MRTLAATLAVLLAAAAQAGGTRTLALDHPAAGLATIDIDTAVGDVEIRGAEVDAVSASVTLRARKGKPTSSQRAAKFLETVELIPAVAGSTLRLRLQPDSRKGEYEASWSLLIPAGAGVRLAAGVGDVRITDVRGGIHVDVGVGDVHLVDVTGEVVIDVGVGDVEVSGPWTAFGPVRASSGVGHGVLRTPEGRRGGRGFLGHELSATGPGAARLTVDAGVGDVTIVLR